MKLHDFLFKKLGQALLLSSLAASVMAAEVNIYDQPKSDAKTVGKVDLSTGIIPIFTPKNSPWIKVADPRNGNVGWIEKKALDTASQNNSVVYTQKIINDGQGAKSYQVMEYGPKNSFQLRQPSQAEIQQWQKRQRMIERQMDESMHHMMRNMQHMYRQQWEFLNATAFPVVTPVVIIPAPKAQPVPRTTTPTAGPETRMPEAGREAKMPAPEVPQPTEAPTAGREAKMPTAGEEATGPQPGSEAKMPKGRN